MQLFISSLVLIISFFENICSFIFMLDTNNKNQHAFSVNGDLKIMYFKAILKQADNEFDMTLCVIYLF